MLIANVPGGREQEFSAKASHGATFDLLIKGEILIKILAIAIHFTLYKRLSDKVWFMKQNSVWISAIYLIKKKVLSGPNSISFKASIK